jgi:hypothetical protein
VATEKKIQKPIPESKTADKAGVPVESSAKEVDAAPQSPTLRENVVMTIKVLAVAAAIAGLIWILDRGVN